MGIFISEVIRCYYVFVFFFQNCNKRLPSPALSQEEEDVTL